MLRLAWRHCWYCLHERRAHVGDWLPATPSHPLPCLSLLSYMKCQNTQQYVVSPHYYAMLPAKCTARSGCDIMRVQVGAVWDLQLSSPLRAC